MAAGRRGELLVAFPKDVRRNYYDNLFGQGKALPKQVVIVISAKISFLNSA